MTLPFPPYLAPLLTKATPLALNAGHCFITQGETDRDVYLLISGKVQTFMLSPNGKQVVLDAFESPAIFGHFAAITHQPRTASASTLTACQFKVVKALDFEKFVEKTPECQKFIFQNLGQSLHKTNESLRRISTLPPEPRLAARLLETPVYTGSQADLADGLGLTRETVSRVLAAWRKQGLVETSRGKITVLNRQGLESLLL